MTRQTYAADAVTYRVDHCLEIRRRLLTVMLEGSITLALPKPYGTCGAVVQRGCRAS